MTRKQQRKDTKNVNLGHFMRYFDIFCNVKHLKLHFKLKKFENHCSNTTEKIPLNTV